MLVNFRWCLKFSVFVRNFGFLSGIPAPWRHFRFSTAPWPGPHHELPTYQFWWRSEDFWNFRFLSGIPVPWRHFQFSTMPWPGPYHELPTYQFWWRSDDFWNFRCLSGIPGFCPEFRGLGPEFRLHDVISGHLPILVQIRWFLKFSGFVRNSGSVTSFPVFN